MTRIMISCPKTGKAVDTGMSLEKFAFDGNARKNYVIWCCPHCQQNHTWRLKDTFLEHGGGGGGLRADADYLSNSHRAL